MSPAAAVTFGSGVHPDPKPGAASLPLVGTVAPDFELANQHGEPIRLSSLQGQNVVLVFFPLAFSGTCTKELTDIRDNLAVFAAADATVVAVSVDSKFSLRAYAQREGYGFDLLADFWPHGSAASRYGVLDRETGTAKRGTFFIDRSGVIRHVLVSPGNQARSIADYRSMLTELAASPGPAAASHG